MFWLENIDEVSIIFVRHYDISEDKVIAWRLKLLTQSIFTSVSPRKEFEFNIGKISY